MNAKAIIAITQKGWPKTAIVGKTANIEEWEITPFGAC